jgi:hypothetical protein
VKVELKGMSESGDAGPTDTDRRVDEDLGGFLVSLPVIVSCVSYKNKRRAFTFNYLH